MSISDSLLTFSLDEVVGVGGSSLFASSSSSGISLIVSRLDSQQNLRPLDIVPILERELDLAVGDLALTEEAFLAPFLDELDVLAFFVMVGCEVSCLVALFAEHRDVAGY